MCVKNFVMARFITRYLNGDKMIYSKILSFNLLDFNLDFNFIFQIKNKHSVWYGKMFCCFFIATCMKYTYKAGFQYFKMSTMYAILFLFSCYETYHDIVRSRFSALIKQIFESVLSPFPHKHQTRILITFLSPYENQLFSDFCPF